MHDTHRTLQNALDALDDVFYIYDEQGKLVFWNDRLSAVFDLTDEEIEGMQPAEFFIEADRPAVERTVQRIFETGEAVVEARAETATGCSRFELTGRKLLDSDGTVLGFCGIGRDVTDRRERERQVEAQNVRLSEFATILAHDLRNPLATAKGYLDRYQTTGETADVDRVVYALERIDRIIDDVFTVAIEGRAVTDARPVALDVAARDAWDTVSPEHAHLDVRAELAVEADESRLRRLLENLFRNCVEHGGQSVTVTISETDTGFAVEDDGPGIPVADRDHVFEPGFSRIAEGTGFGLYIVQTIAEAHGWQVVLSEGATGGARFEFLTLPAATADIGRAS